MAKTFTNVPDAARAVLTVSTLSEKEGQFAGGLAYRRDPLTPKQENWLRILLSRHSLGELTEGGENG